MKTRIFLGGFLLALAGLSLERLVLPNAVHPSNVDFITTAAISTPPVIEIDRLKLGLDALKADDISRAQTLRDQLSVSTLDRHILQWSIALSGSPRVTSSEIKRAQQDLPTWPGLQNLQRNFERALYRENPAPADILAMLGPRKPLSAAGIILLARAYIAQKNDGAALLFLSSFWRSAKLEQAEEMAIIAEFGSLLSPADHFARMEAMLYDERIASASRIAKLANAAELFSAWAAAIRGGADAGSLLKSVPESQKTLASYQFANVHHLRKKGEYKAAAAALSRVPNDARRLVNPDAWWVERRILARALLDLGEAKLAYETASQHSAETPSAAAEAEFHAGWIALRALKKPELAIGHFQRLLDTSSKSQSASRGHYWLGRAKEAAGLDGKDDYTRAAHFGTSFYGQLAAASLGLHTLELNAPDPTDFERRQFASREAVTAIRRLENTGHETRARALYFSLAEELDSVGEIALLAAQAQQKGDHFVALKVGKIAANRGLDVGDLSHPTGAIPVDANIEGSGKALAYAIARQESEFNQVAVSKVGALGLLQLMPATASEVAKRNKMVFDKSRLTSDAAYNATLGSHFLGEQIARFDGSYILTFAGYNAGPRRSKEWIAKYGDPRGKDIDFVVDWIEHIPFTETRNYVQRIMENYQVYKVRLGGSVDIEQDLINGRRG